MGLTQGFIYLTFWAGLGFGPKVGWVCFVAGFSFGFGFKGVTKDPFGLWFIKAQGLIL